MKKMLSIALAVFFTAALAFSPGKAQQQTTPGCVVQPEVIEECVNNGGKFDYKLCSCVYTKKPVEN